MLELHFNINQKRLVSVTTVSKDECPRRSKAMVIFICNSYFTLTHYAMASYMYLNKKSKFPEVNQLRVACQIHVIDLNITAMSKFLVCSVFHPRDPLTRLLLHTE